MNEKDLILIRQALTHAYGTTDGIILYSKLIAALKEVKKEA